MARVTLFDAGTYQLVCLTYTQGIKQGASGALLVSQGQVRQGLEQAAARIALPRT